METEMTCDWHLNLGIKIAAKVLLILGNTQGGTLEGYACRECADSVRYNMRAGYFITHPFAASGSFHVEDLIEVPIEKIPLGYHRVGQFQ